MAIIGITEVIKATGETTLTPVTGKIYRVLNVNSSDQIITVKCTKPGEQEKLFYLIAGKFIDFWYEGNQWRNTGDSVIQNGITRFDAGIGEKIYSSATGSSFVFTGDKFFYDLTLDANCTFTMPGDILPGYGLMLTVILTNDATDGRTCSFTGVKWSGGTPPSRDTSAGAVNIYQFINKGTTWYGFLVGAGIA